MQNIIVKLLLPRAFALGALQHSVLKSKVKPFMEAVASGKPYVFQQDGAPGHTSNLVQNWLLEHVDTFWSKRFWPLNSPDLNPLDYYVWSVVERVTNKFRHPNVTPLRTSVESAFAEMNRSALQCVCAHFRPRIEAVIEAELIYRMKF